MKMIKQPTIPPMPKQPAFDARDTQYNLPIGKDVPDTNVGDTISRQAAIDALERVKTATSENGERWIAKINAQMELEQLPPAQPYTIHSDGRLWVTVDDIDKVTAVVVDEHKSKFCKQFYEDAQPEITYCKDCKHHWTHKCMDSFPIERCDLEQTFYDPERDFCSLAEKREVTT